MERTNNSRILRSLQRIARREIDTGMFAAENGGGGVVWGGTAGSGGGTSGGSRVTGYVSNIHLDEDDELFGTIDVREFVEITDVMEENHALHEGVRLSAIQPKALEGYVIIPALNSEVIIDLDPVTGNEYVVMYSFADRIQLDSFDEVRIQVREREEFTDDEDGPDIDELALTGVETKTVHTKNTITSTVTDGENYVSEQIMDSDGIAQYVGDKESVVCLAKDDISVYHGDSSITLDDNQVLVEKGSSSVTVENGTVYLGSKEGAQDAVLGPQLASILSNLVGLLGQMMTPTAMGPQAPTNVMPSFLALKSQIQSYAASHSGFLTQTVKLK